MINYRYLGYGVTNSNGVAHLTNGADGQPLSENGYTGTGKGLTQIVASTDDKDHISEGSLQSEIYEVSDLLFYDSALTNEKWNSNYANVSLNRELVSNGTKLSYTADSGTRYCNTLIKGVQTWFDSTKAYQVDFDIEWERNSDSAVGCGFGNSGYNIHNQFSGALSGSGHYKIITDGATYQFYLDGVKKGTPITITGNNGFFFLVYRTGSITFSNLKIHEI